MAHGIQHVNTTVCGIQQEQQIANLFYSQLVYSEKTTVLVNNLPPSYSVEAVMGLVDGAGFDGCYAVHALPFAFVTKYKTAVCLKFQDSSGAQRCANVLREHSWPAKGPTIIQTEFTALQYYAAYLGNGIAAVEHDEPKADIHPLEAERITHEQWASLVEHRIRTQAHVPTAELAADVNVSDVGAEQLLLLDFNRNPVEFVNALVEGTQLRACRDALSAYGRQFRLAEGCLIFVHPHQYNAALLALDGTRLRASHVVVARSLEHLVEESLALLRRGVWARDRRPIQLQPEEGGRSSATLGSDAPACEGLARDVFETEAPWKSWPEVTVTRTFINLAAPARRDARSAADSAPAA